MKNVIINTSLIESCWEKNDACLVKMASGKVWVLEKMILGVPTRQFINSKPNEIVELPLKGGANYGK